MDKWQKRKEKKSERKKKEKTRQAKQSKTDSDRQCQTNGGHALHFCAFYYRLEKEITD